MLGFMTRAQREQGGETTVKGRIAKFITGDRARQIAEATGEDQTAPAPPAAAAAPASNVPPSRVTKDNPGGIRFANGGPVRGPGTGTSDDISKEVPEGTYIMPADSTDQIGEDSLASMGARGFQPGKDVPVQVSNGEYELPPEQVHAVGVQALDAMKDATHQPVPEPAARGFAPQAEEPPIFFANGGVVDDERRRSSSFGDAAAAAANPSVTQVVPAPVAAPSPSNAFPGNRQPSPSPYVAAPAVSTGGASGSWDATKPPAGTLTAASAVSGANDAALRFGGTPLTADQQARVRSNFEQEQRDFAAGAQAARTGVAPVFGVSAAPVPTASAAPVAQAGAAPAARGFAAAAARPAAAPPAPAAATVGVALALPDGVSRVAPGIYRSGNSFGDSPAAVAAGFRPGVVSPQNMAAADALEARGMAERADQRAVMDAGAERGFAPGAGLTVIGDDTQADRVRRAAFGAASTPYASSPGGQLTANQVRVLAGMDEANGRNATTRDVSAANNAAAMEREVVQQAGANARAAAGSAVQRGELDLRREAQAPATRAAERQEALYQRYEAAKTPEERSAIAQQLRDLNGKEPANRFTVVPGGQEIDPTTQQSVTRPARVFNNQTGQFVESQGQGAAAGPVSITNDAAGRQRLAALPAGAEFVGPDGKRYRKQ